MLYDYICLVGAKDSSLSHNTFSTPPQHLAMPTTLTLLLRREVLLPLLAVLVLTAPLSTPTYSACVLLTNLVVTCPAHLVFRLYQYQEDTGLTTVVHCLLHLLSILLQVRVE